MLICCCMLLYKSLLCFRPFHFLDMLASDSSFLSAAPEEKSYFSHMLGFCLLKRALKWHHLFEEQADTPDLYIAVTCGSCWLGGIGPSILAR